jgi:DNA-binding NtrC family response regulator
LATLKAIRRDHPELKIVLATGEFDVDFQIAAIQQCGLVSFLTKPCGSSVAVVEQIQVMLGDQKSSIHQRILRIPLAR